MATLGEVLLTPTRIYARAVLAAREALTAAGHDIHGAAHITGGGLPGNVPRALPEGLAARLDPTRWSMPSVVRLFGALGGLDDDGAAGDVQRRAWDGPDRPAGGDPGRPRATGASAASPALVVGEVVEADALDGTRYVEGPLESVA